MKRKMILGNGSIYLILIALFALLSIIKTDTFLTGRNLMNILKQNTTIGIMAFGISFAIMAGGTDLSGGAIVGMTSCMVGLLVKADANGNAPMPILLAIILTLLVGAMCGAINGIVISYGRVPPFIATLGMQLILRGATLIMTDGMPVSGFAAPFKAFGSGALGSVPYVVILFTIIVALVYILLHKTQFGSYVYAIGGSERAAAVSGINTRKIRTIIYVFSGTMAALSGIVLSARTLGALPGYGEGYDMDAISCAVIGGTSFSGGKGTVLGTLAGIFIVALLTNGMTMLQVNSYWQSIVKGVVILVAVLIDQMKERRN